VRFTLTEEIHYVILTHIYQRIGTKTIMEIWLLIMWLQDPLKMYTGDAVNRPIVEKSAISDGNSHSIPERKWFRTPNYPRARVQRVTLVEATNLML
jgi:hypothetical protein